MSFDILNDDMSFLSGMGDITQDISPVVPFQVTATTISALQIQKKDGHHTEVVLNQLSAAEYEQKLLNQKVKEAEEMAKEKRDYLFIISIYSKY